MMLSLFSLPLMKRLSSWLLLKGLLIIIVILYAGIGLGPDEAQYWTWSQVLDWGYYSKPPGIAWQIWFGTKLFGDTELGVRFFSVIAAFFQAIGVYLIALKAGLKNHTAFWCGILMAFSPIGIAGSLFAITDGGMLLCWTGACLVVVSALKENKSPHPMHVGGWILVGALFKWTIFLFWFYYLVSLYFYFPEQKKTLFLKGFLFSLLGLLPSLWWNYTHDWATFRHVFATIGGGSVHKAGGNAAEFLGSQALLVSPILFVLLLAGLYQWFRCRQKVSPPLYFCGLVTFSLLTGAVFLSCFQKVQGNWIDFAYPSGFIIIGWCALEKIPRHPYWMKIGLGLSVLLSIIFFALPSIYTRPYFSSWGLNFRMNPLKHNVGWDELHETLKMEGYDPELHYLFSDKYQTSSILSFYSEGKKRAYFLNLHGIRKNQFSYWPSFNEEQKDKTGFFIWIENTPHLTSGWEVKRDFYLTELKRYFEKVDFISMSPLIDQGLGVAKGILIIRCEECKGVEAVDSNHY